MSYFNIKTTLTVLLTSAALAVSASDTVSISGIVTDFNGNPIDSCAVMIMNLDFQRFMKQCRMAAGVMLCQASHEESMHVSML